MSQNFNLSSHSTKMFSTPYIEDALGFACYVFIQCTWRFKSKESLTVYTIQAFFEVLHQKQQSESLLMSNEKIDYMKQRRKMNTNISIKDNNSWRHIYEKVPPPIRICLLHKPNTPSFEVSKGDLTRLQVAYAINELPTYWEYNSMRN